MKIIDAHLHIFRPSRGPMHGPWVGHENSVEHLRQVYGELEIVHGVVMGNRSLETGFHNYPRDLFHYCVGLDSLVLRRGRPHPGGPARPGGGASEAGELLRREALPRVQPDLAVRSGVRARLPSGGADMTSR